MNPAECGWKNFDAMGIGVAVAYLDWLDEYHVYSEDDLPILVAAMVDAEVISGFNISRFDLPLVEATLKRTGVRIIEGWESLLAKVYDPMLDVCASLGVQVPRGWNLQNIAKSNLSIIKNGDGADAPALYQAGKHARLATYCIQDVRVETHLFRHCRDYRNLKNRFIKMGEEVVVPLRQMDALAKRHGF